MAFYNEKEQIYLETFMLGVGQGASLAIVLTNISLTSAETCYSNIEGSARYTTWPRKISPLLLCLSGQHNYRTQSAGRKI